MGRLAARKFLLTQSCEAVTLIDLVSRRSKGGQVKFMLPMGHTLPPFNATWSFGLDVDIVCA